MLAIVLILLGATMALAEDPLAGLTAADLEHGRQLFRNNCSVCHGFDGTGGTGPSLTRAKFHRAADNAALIELITSGIEDGGMPPSWHLLPNGPRLVAGYVRTLGQVREAAVPGDIGHGRAVYKEAGCTGCHIVNGEGVALGPELTDVGLRRTANLMRQIILHPESAVPQGFLMMRVQPGNGPELLGVRVNEDSFTIQIKDASGQFHSFQKADLTKLERQSGRTLMPSYAGSLSGARLDDLVAYLTGLRGAQ